MKLKPNFRPKSVKPIKEKVIQPKPWRKFKKQERKDFFLLVKSGKTIKEACEIFNGDYESISETFQVDKYQPKQSVSKILLTEDILLTKIKNFCKVTLNNKTITIQEFTVEEFLNKIGNNPKCYLTGDIIDLSQKDTFQLDHIIPRSKGGDNSLSNCGLISKQANMVKHDLLLDELIIICQKIINNN